jgi:GTP-binding protein
MAVSAKTGRGLTRMVAEAVDVADRAAARIPTPQMNRFLGDVQQAKQPPSRRGKRLKLYYLAQYETSPPRFALQVNDRTLITRSYGYFIENQLRERFGLHGVPVVIDFKDAPGRRHGG